MTSFSPISNAAVLILQQANAAVLANDVGTESPTDKIAAIINGVSSEDSAVKTQASSRINSGLRDVKQANDSIVSNALKFLVSDNFKSSDPSVKDTLKQLISEEGSKFAALVRAEKAKHPGTSDDNAIANAIQGLIRSNRDKFTDDEFVIGFRFANGGKILANIEDINGNSTTKSLDAIRSANHAAMTSAGLAFRAAYEAAIEAYFAAGEDPSKLISVEAGKSLDETTKALLLL